MGVLPLQRTSTTLSLIVYDIGAHTDVGLYASTGLLITKSPAGDKKEKYEQRVTEKCKLSVNYLTCRRRPITQERNIEKPRDDQRNV